MYSQEYKIVKCHAVRVLSMLKLPQGMHNRRVLCSVTGGTCDLVLVYIYFRILYLPQNLFLLFSSEHHGSAVCDLLFWPECSILVNLW